MANSHKSRPASRAVVEQLEARRLLAVLATGTIAEGSAYALDLSLFDRGDKPLAGWTINWGDGSVDTIDGDVPTATHTYLDGPQTHSITAVPRFTDGTQATMVRPGEPDLTFADGGFMIDRTQSVLRSSVDVAIQADDKIVVQGYSAPSTLAAARYLPNGQLDTSFGTNGRTVITSGGTDGAIAIAPDGKILLGGQRNIDGDVDMIIARLNADGTIDDTFGGGDGIVILDFQRHDYVHEIVPLSDGRIVVGGQSFLSGTSGINRQFAVARLLADGTPDPAFDADGMTLTSFGTQQAFLNALTVQPDGRVVAAGRYGGNAQQNSQAILARYDTDGTLDETFGTDGRSWLPTTGGEDYSALYSVAVLPDGRLFTSGAGTTLVGATRRLTASGVPDPTYANGGIRDYPDFGALLTTKPASDAAEKFVAAGLFPGPNGSISIGRVAAADGAYDLGYGSGGRSIIRPGQPLQGYMGFAVDSRGRAVIAQEISTFTGGYTVYGFLLLRLQGGEADNVVVKVENVAPAVDAGPDETGAAGMTLSFPRQVVDPGADTITGTVNYGDNTGVQPLAIDPADKRYVLSHLYRRPGTYTVTVTAKDDENASATDTMVINVTHPAGFTITGPGAPDYDFSGPATGQTLTIRQGTATWNRDAGIDYPNLTIHVIYALNFGATQHLHGLSVNGVARVTAGGEKVIVARNLNVSATGLLDLRDNDLVVDYASVSPVGIWTGTTYNGISGLIRSGKIISSTAAGATTLGVAEARDVLKLTGTQTAAFAGQVVDSTAVLVKYTYAGDANLDGVINIDDYGRIDSNVAQSGSVWGWFNGDFNYDGAINIDDYGIIDSNIGEQDGVL